jgi:hypothetical protein
MDATGVFDVFKRFRDTVDGTLIVVAKYKNDRRKSG